MSKDFVTRDLAEPADSRPEPSGRRVVVVAVRAEKIVGVAAEDAAAEDRLAPCVMVEPQDPATSVLRAMAQSGARVALVVRSRESTSPRDLVGVITNREIADAACSTASLE